MLKRIFPFLLLFLSGLAYAGDYNYQNYVIGEEAAGMGGAYTALSESAEGTFYNPGGIVFAKDKKISLSANLFQLTRGKMKNRVVIGSIQRDLSLSSLQVIPTSSVALSTFRLKWDDPEGPPKNAWAFSFYTPDSVLFKGKREVISGGTASFLTFRLQDSLFLAGPSYARRLTDTLGVGLSLFYAYREFSNQVFVTATTEPTFLQNFTLVDLTYGGLIANVGLKWRFHPNWHFGFSVRPPSIKLNGGGDNFLSSATNGAASTTNPQQTVLRGLSVNLPLPMKLASGIAFRNDKWTLSGDVNLYLPNSFLSVQDPQNRASAAQIKQNLVINGNLGVEYFIRPKIPLRWGFFTNFSSSPSLGSAGASDTKIDYYGGALSIAYNDRPFATQIGLQGNYGNGRHLIGTSQDRAYFWNVSLMVATSFNF